MFGQSSINCSMNNTSNNFAASNGSTFILPSGLSASNNSSSTKKNVSTKIKVSTLPDDTLESCKCDYCKCYVSVGPIRMIDNKIACGRCCQDKDGTRVLMIEALAKEFNFPCRYKSRGCDAFLKWALIDAHEKECNNRGIQCTITDCNWNGAKSTLKSHFEEKHSTEIVNFHKGVWINLHEKKSYNYLYVSKNNAFLVFLSNNGETIQHQIRFFCTSLVACMYKYNICVYTSDKKVMFLNQKLQSFDDDIGMFNIGIQVDILKSMFLNVDNINISFQIQHSNDEPTEMSIQSIECPVCLEPMLGNIYIRQCGHSFCEKCKKLLQNCPYCRSSISTGNNYNFGFGAVSDTSATRSNQEIRNYSLEGLIKKLNFEL